MIFTNRQGTENSQNNHKGAGRPLRLPFCAFEADMLA